jgi:hypothetical protein
VKAFLILRDTYIYENKSTLDKWEITHEEFEVMDEGQPPLRVTYTATFYWPEHLRYLKNHEPYLDTIPKVLQPLLDEKDYEEAQRKIVTELIDIHQNFMVTNLTFRFSANAFTEEELENKRAAVYKELMAQLHAYSPLKVLPASIREKIKSGEIEY